MLNYKVLNLAVYKVLSVLKIFHPFFKKNSHVKWKPFSKTKQLQQQLTTLSFVACLRFHWWFSVTWHVREIRIYTFSNSDLGSITTGCVATLPRLPITPGSCNIWKMWSKININVSCTCCNTTVELCLTYLKNANLKTPFLFCFVLFFVFCFVLFFPWRLK